MSRRKFISIISICVAIAIAIIAGVWYNEARMLALNPKNGVTATCNDSQKYFVISRDHTDSVGTDILVKYKTNATEAIPCRYAPTPGDLEITNEDAAYFYGFASDFLVLDSGTGPPPRTMILYDLVKKKRVYDDTYDQPLSLRANSITYWQPTTEKPTAANCPQLGQYTVDGLGIVMESYVALSLQDLTVKSSGQSRCMPTQ